MAIGVATDAETIQITASVPSAISTAQLPGGGVAGGRNEFISFQIVVGGPATVTGVAVAPFGPFAVNNIHVFTEWPIPLGPQTAGNNCPGSVPFIMWPVGLDDVVGELRSGGLPLNIPSGQVRTWWVDLFVPQGTTPGTYNGTAIVSISGQGDTSILLNVAVFPYTLPVTSSCRSLGPVYYNDIKSQHNGTGDQGVLNQICARYAQLALDHRYSFSGWDTGDTDLNHWNQYFGQFLDGTAPTQIKGAKWSAFMQGSSWGGLSPLWGGSGAFVANAVSRGWIDKLVAYTDDEPPTTGTWWAICPNNSTWKSVNSSIRSLVTIDIGQANNNGVLGCIDILCPIIEQFWPPGQGNHRGDYNNWLSGGSQRQVWCYQSLDEYNAGWLQYTADAVALQQRQMIWMEYLSNCQGDLFFDPQYRCGANGGTPWNGIYIFGGNGGAWLLPGCAQGSPNGSPSIGGSTDIPLSSMLMKQIRQGMQDYERGKLLDAANDSTMRQLGAQMFPSINSRPAVATFAQNQITIGSKIAGGGLNGSTPEIHIVSVSPVSGPPGGGNEITILGSPFETGDKVVFGATAAATNVLSLTEMHCIAPPNAAGAVDITITAKSGLTGTLHNAYVYNAPVLSKSGPPLDSGWPVTARVTASSIGSISVNAPSTPNGPFPGGRLVYCGLVWNTRNLANVQKVTVSDNHSNKFVRVYGADFDSSGSPVAPMHQGADIWAFYYPAGVPSGTTFTALFGVTTTMDCLFTVYSRYNVVDASRTPLDAFGYITGTTNSGGGSGALSIKLNKTNPGCTGIVVMEDGTGSGGISPLDNTHLDTSHNPLTSMAIGTLLDGTTAKGGDITIGSHNNATYYCIAAAEILPSPQLVPPTISSINPGVANVDGGDVITMIGSNFLPVAQIAVQTASGATIGPSTYTDSNTYTFIAPAHAAGPVDVAYHGPDGQTVILAQALTYTQNALQIESQNPNAISKVGRGSKLTQANAMFMVHGLQDLALKRVQDQNIGTINPIIQQVRHMPAASNGQWDVEPWAQFHLLGGWKGPSNAPGNTIPPQPAFYKDTNGMVRLRGSLYGGVLGTVAGILPPGYRPGFTVSIPTTNGAAKGSVVIDAAGGVVPGEGTPAKGISLNGISFRAEDVAPGGSPPPYLGAATTPFSVTIIDPNSLSSSMVFAGSGSSGSNVNTSVPGPTSPTTPDVFGVQEIYGSLIGGQSWVMNMAAPASDSRASFNTPVFPVYNANGSINSWNAQINSNNIYAYTVDGYTLNSSTDYNRLTLASQGYMGTPNDWRNVEITAIWHVNAFSASTQLYLQARGGKQGSGRSCEGCGYRFVVLPASNICYMAKESSDGVWITQPSRSFTMSSSFLGSFIGMKAVIRNLQNGTTDVRMEGYLEPTGGTGSWVSVDNFDDAGSFGGTANTCGGTNSSMTINWGGPVISFGWVDCNNLGFRWLSAREISAT